MTPMAGFSPSSYPLSFMPGWCAVRRKSLAILKSRMKLEAAFPPKKLRLGRSG